MPRSEAKRSSLLHLQVHTNEHMGYRKEIVSDKPSLGTMLTSQKWLVMYSANLPRQLSRQIRHHPAFCRKSRKIPRMGGRAVRTSRHLRPGSRVRTTCREPRPAWPAPSPLGDPDTDSPEARAAPLHR